MQKTRNRVARQKVEKRRPTRPKVRLDANARPLQDRARSTYDSILQAAGELLAEVGIERLSTNLVCKRAGLTPPALYRYFPNKYALLKELGARLMSAQDSVVFDWQDRGENTGPTSIRGMADARRHILYDVNRVTKAFPGGGWVMRALRAVPTLSAVRIASREMVAERDFAALAKRYPRADRCVLRIAATLCVEVSYAALELVTDQPELDADLVMQEISHMVALYVDSFAKPRAKK
ncbi:MAG: helix-turn-helix domain-containing protein [Rhizomicrobium sp.]